MLTQASLSALLLLSGSAIAAPFNGAPGWHSPGKRDNATQNLVTANSSWFPANGTGPGVVNGQRQLLSTPPKFEDNSAFVNPSLLWRGRDPEITDFQMGSVGDYALAAIASAIITIQPSWFRTIIFPMRATGYNDGMYFNAGVLDVNIDSTTATPYTYAETEDNYQDPQFWVNLFSLWIDRTRNVGAFKSYQVPRGDSAPNRRWIDVLQTAGGIKAWTGENMSSCPSEDVYGIHRQHWYHLLTRHNATALQFGPSVNATNVTLPNDPANYQGWKDLSSASVVDRNKAFYTGLSALASVPTIVSTKTQTTFLPPDADLVVMQFTNKTTNTYDDATFPDLLINLLDPFNQTNPLVFKLSEVLSDTHFVIHSPRGTLELPALSYEDEIIQDAAEEAANSIMASASVKVANAAAHSTVVASSAAAASTAAV